MPFKQHPTDPTKVVYVTRDYMQSPNLIDACIICSDCGQKVTVDSIHTCSPQTLTKDTECQYCKQRCFRCDARKILTDEEIKTIYYETGDLFDFARAILKKAQEK